jgi:hypothetical protein
MRQVAEQSKAGTRVQVTCEEGAKMIHCGRVRKAVTLVRRCASTLDPLRPCLQQAVTLVMQTCEQQRRYEVDMEVKR